VIDQTLKDYDAGIIGYQKAKDLIDGINRTLEAKGLKPIKVEIIPEYKKAFDNFRQDALSITGTFEGINSVVSSVTSLSESIKEDANAW
jgi:Tfp pilus assembly protein PilO